MDWTDLDALRWNQLAGRADPDDDPHPPLLIIRAPYGILACGYLDPRAFGSFGDAAVVVRGVRTFDDMLATRPAEEDISPVAAKRFGITRKMNGKRILYRFREPPSAEG